jgi:HK97 family phage major capsid protein
LITFLPTVMSRVDFVKEDSFTNSASPQAETTPTDKADSTLALTTDTAPVRTIAHWIAVARQVLDDLDRLAQYINTRLLVGLADIEDYELLRGTGVSPHISGIITKATAYVGTYDDSGDTRLDKLNHALAELESAEYDTDGIILNPVDARIIQLIKTEDGGTNKGLYILGGPGVPLTSLWGKPVVTTNAMQVGTFLVGQFSGSVEGYDRMSATIDVSTSHSDFFIKNLVAIRAEERVAMGVLRPAAFRYGSF